MGRTGAAVGVKRRGGGFAISRLRVLLRSCGLVLLGALIAACSGRLRDDEPRQCEGDDCLSEKTCSDEVCDGTCVENTCIPVCSLGNTLCGELCVDLSQSEAHCGGCESACAEGESCNKGSCSTSCRGDDCQCASGRNACDDVCVDTSSHPFHCGKCGVECHASEECVEGSCICPQGRDWCGDICVDPLSENKHCGECGNVCVGGTSCENGDCDCPQDQTLCGGVCVDMSVSRNHCGECGVSCEGNDRCTLGRCDDSEDDCGGAATDVDISRVAIFQAVEIPLFEQGALVATTKRNADVVENRDALVRVHVETAPVFLGRELSARVFIDNEGEVKLFHHKRHTASSSTQSDFSSTFNITLPADQLGPETQYRVELVECGENNPNGVVGNIRVPQADSLALDARLAGAVEVVLIPVAHDGRLPDTSAGTMAAYAREVERVFPVSGISLTVAEAIESHQEGFDVDLDLLLDDITTLRAKNAVADHIYYYGLIDPAASSSEYCSEGCTTGLGWVSRGNSAWAKKHRVAVGVGFGTWGAETFSHELGHNHGRDHSPCGVDDGDTGYPYENAALGSWGYDSFSGSLRAPDQYVDLMSYCSPPWISDYNYQAVLEQVIKVNQSVQSEALRQGTPSGEVAQTWARVLVTDKVVRWSEAFTAPGEPSEHPESGLIYDEAEAVVAQVAVHRMKVADSSSYMLFVPPKEPGWMFIVLSDGTSIPY